MEHSVTAITEAMEETEEWHGPSPARPPRVARPGECQEIQHSALAQRASRLGVCQQIPGSTKAHLQAQRKS